MENDIFLRYDATPLCIPENYIEMEELTICRIWDSLVEKSAEIPKNQDFMPVAKEYVHSEYKDVLNENYREAIIEDFCLQRWSFYNGVSSVAPIKKQRDNKATFYCWFSRTCNITPSDFQGAPYTTRWNTHDSLHWFGSDVFIWPFHINNSGIGVFKTNKPIEFPKNCNINWMRLYKNWDNFTLEFSLRKGI